MTFETLKVERHGPVGWLVFNRPERKNALNQAMHDELPGAWRELDGDPAVRVIVNTGEGRDFQSGMDLVETASLGMDRFGDNVRSFQLGITGWHNQVGKPVIAAVNGLCVGAGFHWMTDADLVIAASDAQFLDPHVSVGQVSVFESIGLLSRIPAEAAFRLALVGSHERMPAQRAYELGLVGEIIDPPDRLRERAQQLGETIARNSPAALRATKKAMWRAFELGRSEAERLGAQEMAAFWSHPDNREGPAAFPERREPVWQPPNGADAALEGAIIRGDGTS
jgi:enoyl-CoA hydratase